MATPLYCRKCGVSLPDSSLFCPACGASQMENNQAQTSTPQQEAVLMGTGRQPTGHMLHQRYRLLHTVGQGGMGAVYVAQDTQLGDRLVAVKEMSMSRLAPQDLPQAIEQFRREAHLLASLHHPNLPAIHEYFRENDRWYLVMSFIEGQNLQVTLNTAPGNRLPVNEVIQIGIELCGVMEYLHTHEPQIIFRDLKPLNIMLTPKGHICLIDFGIARHFKQEQAKDTAYYYSVGYAPPEQYGQSQTGPRSDIYSLGATLHQMLSGHNPSSKPFQFPNLQLIDPTIPAPLATLIAQMLDMNELARPVSATVVREQLEHILTTRQAEPVGQVETKGKEQSQTIPADSTPPPAPPSAHSSSEKQRRWRAWTGFILLSLIAGAILPWLNYQAGGETPFAIANAGIPSGPPAITIIGAMIVTVFGLLFLFLKKRPPLLTIPGGMTLGVIAFINLAVSQYRTYYTFEPDYYLYFMGDYPHYYFNFFLFLTLFSLWLFIGTRLFLQGANVPGRMLWGMLFLIGGISLLLPQGQFFPSPLTVLPAIICEMCGAISIVAAIRKLIRESKHEALAGK